MTSAPLQHDAPIQVEGVVLRVRRHGRHLTLPIIVLIAVAAAAGFWVGTFADVWINATVAGGAALVALVLGLGPLLSWLTRRTVVTNRRVIFRSGLFTQRRTELPLSRVREVHSKRNLVQRMFGSGDIELVGGIDGATVLRDVPDCTRVASALQELIEHNFMHGPTGSFGGFGQGGSPGPRFTQVVHGDAGDTTPVPR